MPLEGQFSLLCYLYFFLLSEVTDPRYLRWFWELELCSVVSDYSSTRGAIAFFGREMYSACKLAGIV